VPRPPSAVFDATPAGTCGSVCNIARALVGDGVAAGLDCAGGGTVQIDAVHVTSCIGADFGASVTLDPLLLRMRSVASACGTACGGTNCGTGHTALVFFGQQRGIYEFAAEIPITPNFRDYSVTLGLAARYVLICRTGAGAFRDDVTVDSILSHASCR
jgi:hypothetical protein